MILFGTEFRAEKLHANYWENKDHNGQDHSQVSKGSNGMANDLNQCV